MPRPKVGDKVRVVGIMPDDPDPLPVGLEGVVTYVSPPGPLEQYRVEWEGSRSLMLLPHDPFIIL